MSDHTEIELSRRRILGGIGAIGVASAGAALGTSSYFSDEESFTDNVMTAGTLDLKVGWQQIYYGPTAGDAVRPRDSQDGEFVNAHPDHDDDGQQSITVGETTYTWNDGGPTGAEEDVTDHLNCDTIPPVPEDDPYGEGQESLVELDDVKPGDGGQITFNLCLCDNPGYIWLTLSDLWEVENGTTEPEADADSTMGADLASNMDVYVSIDENCNSRFNSEDTTVWSGTLAEAQTLVEEESNGIALGEECFDSGCFCVNVGWEVPTDVGNEIQGDSISFDLGFYTEQCRHNDEPSLPAEAEFRSLFDSGDFDPDTGEFEGWHQINGPAEYYAEDDTIVGESVENSPNSFLTSYEMFDDFELRMEVGRDPPNVPEPLNSGIQARSNSSDERVAVHGPQAEIGLSNNPMFPPPQPGRVWGESLGTGWMSTSEPIQVFDDTGWNDYRIRAEGDQLEVWVNDTKTADVDLGAFDLGEFLVSTGFVGLQVHGVGGGEGGRTVRWRNIRIKELDTDEWAALGPSAWSNDTGSGSVSASGGTLELSDGASFFVHSADTYDDFEFETWVNADAEGGLLFRNGSDSAANGYRVDVDPTGSQLSGSLYDSGAGSYLKDISTSGEAAHLQAAFHPDEWNYLRVKAEGDELRIWVNGITTANLTDSAHADGYLGLQHLGGSGTIRFRDMQVNPIE